MIKNTFTSKRVAALTSSRWHVVHARFLKSRKLRPFTRSIVSEHDDRKAAVLAARALLFTLRRDAGDCPVEECDQVFVRRPNYKSFKTAQRVIKMGENKGK